MPSLGFPKFAIPLTGEQIGLEAGAQGQVQPAIFARFRQRRRSHDRDRAVRKRHVANGVGAEVARTDAWTGTGGIQLLGKVSERRSEAFGGAKAARGSIIRIKLIARRFQNLYLCRICRKMNPNAFGIIA